MTPETGVRHIYHDLNGDDQYYSVEEGDTIFCGGLEGKVYLESVLKFKDIPLTKLHTDVFMVEKAPKPHMDNLEKMKKELDDYLRSKSKEEICKELEAFGFGFEQDNAPLIALDRLVTSITDPDWVSDFNTALTMAQDLIAKSAGTDVSDKTL